MESKMVKRPSLAMEINILANKKLFDFYDLTNI